MPKRGSDLRSILSEMDGFLDEILGKMDSWEEELHRTMRKGDDEEVLDVARKGNAFGRDSKEARVELLEARNVYKEDLSDGALDEANAAVEAKLRLIDERLQRAMEEVLSRQQALDERTRKALSEMESLGDLDLNPDSSDEEDMRKMREELAKEKKVKKTDCRKNEKGREKRIT